ncbi:MULTISPECIES: GFA family protein [Vibrio]|uniref:GFA family protein n=1 Tax=Vibrio TaxID=662 RepID=UPI0003132B20|nr:MULTISPECIES: GFA family protein [Vibrio]ERM60892.1 Gfa-like protein [Vibrio cyclitrophicus FF75]MBE8605912.1 GFA family protein [Vibrio sp. OPT10]MCC4774187.1 GFA family protein [Vibrio cyclitrophicus]MCC4840743.1 GFA family protein [Vibrio cyclitrophicus]MDH5880594.1 GFA family protein [Vibrio sp. S/42/10]|tara:strand:- start:2556 stop:2963 length:408 start_codon:yes stop_codon:yes gene_type:complete
MYQGSCLCGSIQLSLKGSVSNIIHCHCSLCRKASGSAYATNGFIEAENLILTDADNTLTYYESSEGKRKYFCNTCGSPIYSSNDQSPKRLRLRLGILDTDISERPISHNFVTSKANWEDLDAQLPRSEKHEVGRT